MSIWLSGVASFWYVFLKALQQRNVVANQYAWIGPISLAMAATEAVVVVNVARRGWYLPLILCTGVGATMGCALAMWMHTKWIGRGANGSSVRRDA